MKNNVRKQDKLIEILYNKFCELDAHYKFEIETIKFNIDQLYKLLRFEFFYNAWNKRTKYYINGIPIFEDMAVSMSRELSNMELYIEINTKKDTFKIFAKNLMGERLTNWQAMVVARLDDLIQEVL